MHVDFIDQSREANLMRIIDAYRGGTTCRRSSSTASTTRRLSTGRRSVSAGPPRFAGDAAAVAAAGGGGSPARGRALAVTGRTVQPPAVAPSASDVLGATREHRNAFVPAHLRDAAAPDPRRPLPPAAAAAPKPAEGAWIRPGMTGPMPTRRRTAGRRSPPSATAAIPSARAPTRSGACPASSTRMPRSRSRVTPPGRGAGGISRSARAAPAAPASDQGQVVRRAQPHDQREAGAGGRARARAGCAGRGGAVGIERGHAGVPAVDSERARPLHEAHARRGADPRRRSRGARRAVRGGALGHARAARDDRVRSLLDRPKSSLQGSQMPSGNRGITAAASAPR